MQFYWYRCLIKNLQNACFYVNKKRVGYKGDLMIRSVVNMRRIKDVQDVNNENNDRAGFYLSF